MPLVRFEIRNELSLGGPKLNRSSVVEDEEPKAILSSVEVAGLVGILRQLGDLAEFSAEVFNGIQEEVTVTASRCQKLTSRVKRIESALSPLEKAVLSQTSHIHFAYTAGCEWHPRIKNGQRHFVQSDLPLCVMETYEKCRDPPPLHLLDRFDAGGPGSCLRKYSDPTFFRKELSNSSKADDVKVQRDQAHRKRKKKRLPQRNICRSRAVSVSTSEETNGARLSSHTDDRQTTSQSTSTVDMPRSSNMQDLSDIIDQSHLQEQSEAQVQSDFQESSRPRDSVTGSGYIEYVINQSPVKKPDVKLLEGFLSSLQPADRIGSAVPEGCIEVVDDNVLYSPSEDIPLPCATIVCDEKKETLESRVEKSNKDEEASEIHESKFGPDTPDRVRPNIRDFDRTYSFFDEVDIVGQKQSNSQANSVDGKPGMENQDFDRTYSFFDEVDTLGESQANSNNGKPGVENEEENKSEQESEGDEFLDARNTIDSESESEHDGVPKPNLEHYFGDISTYCSEDANSDNNDGSEDIPYESMAEDPRHDESCSYLPEDANESCFLSDPVCGKALSYDEIFQQPKEFVTMSTLLFAEEAVPEKLREEPVAAHPLLAGECADEKISSDESIASCLSLEDDMPSEKILPEEEMANSLSLVEAVPHDKILPEESVAKSPSLAEVVSNEKMLPEKPLPTIPSLVEVVPDNMRIPAEELDSTPKAAQDEKIPPDSLHSTTLSVSEDVSQEQISPEDFVGIYPSLVETVHDERFLTEESATLTEAMPMEKVLPEKPLEVHHSLAELPKKEKSDEVTHPSCVEAASEENISTQVFDSTNLSVAEAVPHEQISLDEVVGIDQYLAEAVPDERTEESDITCLSSKRAVAMEKVLPEEPLETYPSLEELPEEETLHEEADDATHPSFSQAVSDAKLSPEVLDPTYLSVAEVVPQEPISLDEVVPDTCLSLEKTVATEQVLPEELLETYPSLAKLPEENISHEEADTHPSLSQAVSDVKISPEVLDSTKFSLEETVTQEQILVEESIGIYPCLVEAVLGERSLPEEPGTTCMSLTKVVPIEEVMPEEPLEVYDSLEKMPDDNISQEESDDATHPSCAKAESDENVSPEVLDTKTLSVVEAIPQEQTSLEEEFVGIDPCVGEAFPDEKVLPEEPVTTCLSLTKVVPIEHFFPEETLEVYPSLEEFSEQKISQEEELDDTTHPSFSEVVGDEKISALEGLGSIYPSLVESVPDTKTSHEELVDTNPFLELAVPSKRSFSDEPGVTYQSPAEAVSKEMNLPEEPLPTYPSLAEAVFSLEVPKATCLPFSEGSFDENISGSEAPGSTIEAGPHNKSFSEEHVATNMFLAEAVFDKKISSSEAPGTTTEAVLHNKSSPEEHVAMDASLAEAVFDEKIRYSEAPVSAIEAGPHNKTFPEEPVATDKSLTEAVFDENTSGSEAPGSHFKSFPEEHVATDASLAEAVFDEKILGSEAPVFAIETGPHNKNFPEEHLAMGMSLAKALFDEKIPGSEAPDSTTETGPHNKTFPEEPVATDMSLAEAVFIENISGSESPGSTTEAVPDNKSFHDEYVATDMSLAEAVFDEKIPHSEAPVSTIKTDPHNKTFPEEPVATSSGELVADDNTLPKEPAAGYLDLAEGIPDQKVFLDDAAFLSFAEAIFDQKFSPDVPDSPENQESLSNDASVEPVSIWSNGGILGLAPSKPPVFAEPNSVSKHIQNEINEEARKQGSSSRSVEDTEKTSLSLVASDQTSQQQSNTMSHSNGSLSGLQSTATSFKVFGLSHRLLMAGFRGNSSSTCKFESIPTTSYDTEVAAIEDKTRDYESSLFGSPTSSPPVEHMKISFNPVDASPVSKLKLRIPSHSQRNGEKADMFPSFQLVPDNSDDDVNSDIFCQSSPGVSDNCLSDSELWESDESPRKSVSSVEKEVGIRGEMGSFSGSFLDLPCFDAVDHHQSTSSTLEQEQEHKPSVLEIIRHWPPNQPKNLSE
ncbi:hypothetical protein AALP_AA7G008700 [Arabis alpina]|uniref:WH2 domain-containing protein n=1 Tax=Arabis alpina TaxID=50452 RepID=A0A087GF78_ARAAL|nr:hypothetical protein AALP_AA7G008700 [Arabis alpina]